MIYNKALAALFGIALMTSGAQGAKPAPVVRVVEGAVIGNAAAGIERFLGLPYAAPPVGARRWAAPGSPEPWSGIRDATAYAPACAQTAAWITERKSENCLYLNVWTPAHRRKDKLPVIVWIHGGGFYGGSGAQPLYDGTRLARRGAVIVTINYRLGVFGFFAHPELTVREHVTGNQGLLDQVAALRWVRRNISAFGGDPGRVTIMGESAGGESVAVLSSSSFAGGLFQRAIAQSGNYGVPLTSAEVADYDPDTAKAAGLALGQRLGRPSLDLLRHASSAELLRQPWSPRTTIDGGLIREDMATAYRSHHAARVPLLLGWNSNEGVDLAPELLETEHLTAANYPALMEKLLGRPPGPALVAAYPAGNDTEAKASLERFTTDWWGWRMWSWAKLHRFVGRQPTWMYYFIHWPAEPTEPCGYGCKAGHGAEIRYAFDQLDQDRRAWTPDDRRLAGDMARYWINFAGTGDPNGTGVPAWRVFDGSEASVRRIGTEAETRARGQLPIFGILAP